MPRRKKEHSGGVLPDHRFALAGDVNPVMTMLTEADLSQLMSPDFLSALNLASGYERNEQGFLFQLIDEPPPGIPEWCIGFTDMRTKVIYIVKPTALHLIQKERLGKAAVKGLLRHEGGHHAPEVLKLDRKLRNTLGQKELEPPELQDYFTDATPARVGHDDTTIGNIRRAAYWRAVMSDIFNGALDVWLEQYGTRGEFTTEARHDLLALHTSSEQGRPKELFEQIPLHHQLTQWLVGEEQYLGIGVAQTREARKRLLQQTAVALLDPRVANAVRSLRDKHALHTLMNTEIHANWAATERDFDAAIEKKYTAVIQYIYEAWKKLFVEAFRQEVEKENKKEDKTAEKEILDKLLRVTTELGQKAFGSQTPADADEHDKEKKITSILKGEQPTQSNEVQPPEATLTPDSGQALRQENLTGMEKKTIEDLAGRFNVSPESIRESQRIENEFALEIHHFATVLAEILIDERMPKIESGHREGMLKPGLEHVIIGARKTGERDLQIFNQTVISPEQTEADVELLFDTSGSMKTGKRLQLAQTMGVVVTRGFQQANEILSAQQFVDPSRGEVLRIGSVAFADNPKRIKKLTESITAQTVPQMIEQTNTFTGGTDDAAAVEALSTQFRRNENRVLKFLVIASDGEGNVGSLRQVLQSIEQHNDMTVIIVGMGSNADSVSASYETEARSRGATNIFVLKGTDVRGNVKKLSDYLLQRFDRRN